LTYLLYEGRWQSFAENSGRPLAVSGVVKYGSGSMCLLLFYFLRM
jgi:hypothetical protein